MALDQIRLKNNFREKIKKIYFLELNKLYYSHHIFIQQNSQIKNKSKLNSPTHGFTHKILCQPMQS